jgi:hypothetical protein
MEVKQNPPHRAQELVRELSLCDLIVLLRLRLPSHPGQHLLLRCEVGIRGVTSWSSIGGDDYVEK